MGKIYVIGSSNTDMVVKTSTLPKPGQTVMGGEFFMNPGGKGANQAVAAARLGGDVVLVANVGNDLFGDQALSHFGDEKIDCSYISKDATHPSGVALISVDNQAENHIVVAPGANGHLSAQHVDRALGHTISQDLVLIQLEIPLETVAYAIRLAKEKGLRVILNPAPASTLSADILKGVYMITPNETEASILTGIDVTDASSARLAGQKLLEMGIEQVVITLGSQGALWVSKDGAELIKASTVKAVDTTAAGDCFNGALTVALAEKMAIQQAIRLACQAAAISVTRLGAQASMPYKQELTS